MAKTYKRFYLQPFDRHSNCISYYDEDTAEHYDKLCDVINACLCSGEPEICIFELDYINKLGEPSYTPILCWSDLKQNFYPVETEERSTYSQD